MRRRSTSSPTPGFPPSRQRSQTATNVCGVTPSARPPSSCAGRGRSPAQGGHARLRLGNRHPEAAARRPSRARRPHSVRRLSPPASAPHRTRPRDAAGRDATGRQQVKGRATAASSRWRAGLPARGGCRAPSSEEPQRGAEVLEALLIGLVSVRRCHESERLRDSRVAAQAVEPRVRLPVAALVHSSVKVVAQTVLPVGRVQHIERRGARGGHATTLPRVGVRARPLDRQAGSSPEMTARHIMKQRR